VSVCLISLRDLISSIIYIYPYQKGSACYSGTYLLVKIPKRISHSDKVFNPVFITPEKLLPPKDCLESNKIHRMQKKEELECERDR
jgi:hypothetical protein